jgi:hypothetical protein
MRVDGSEHSLAYTDDSNKWVSHISPDGQWIAFRNPESSLASTERKITLRDEAIDFRNGPKWDRIRSRRVDDPLPN